MPTYLTTRDKSPYLYLKLQNPPRLASVLGWKVKIKSTGKTDEHEALRVVLDPTTGKTILDEIIEHKELLVLARAYDSQEHRGRMYGVREFRANQERHNDDGSVTTCSSDGLWLVTVKDGKFLAPIPNPVQPRLNLYTSEYEAREIAQLKALRTKPERDLDREIFQHWAKDQKHGPQTILKKFMETMHAIVPNRSLATIDVRDVRALEEHLRVNEHNSTGSLHSKFGLASAMVTKAIGHEDFPMLKANPFKVKDLIKQGVKGRRAATVLFDDDDFRRISADLPNWPDHLRLFWIMLRTMGGRRSEPTQIRGDKMIDGYQCIEYGTKTQDGVHRVEPLSKAVLDQLQGRRFEGKLFPHTAGCMANNIRDRLADLGIPEGTGKTLKSLRAGFETELGRKKVPQGIIDTIMGHVLDDMQGNAGGNQEARRKKGTKWAYMRGYEPAELFDAMNLIQSGI